MKAAAIAATIAGVLASHYVFSNGPTAPVFGLARVIDGDTLDMMGLHVRLQGLDAEELAEPHGLAAKRYMQWLTIGRTVTCYLTGEKSHDRYVGRCEANGKDLSAEMVAAGYALDCERFSGGRYRALEPTDSRTRLISKPYCRKDR